LPVDLDCVESSDGFALWPKATGPVATQNKATSTHHHLGERIIILSAEIFQSALQIRDGHHWYDLSSSLNPEIGNARR